ncbi:MAG: radical SAM protein [Candidatus Hydrothermarchaeota archaeon]
MDFIKPSLILKSALGNPATRKLLNSISCWCKECQKNRLEVAIDLWIDRRREACIKCRSAEKILSKLLEIGSISFGVSEKEIRNTFSDPYYGKGLACVLKGIAKFGITKPFTPGSPFMVVWDITHACNLKCKHCYATADKNSKNELNTEKAKLVIDKLDRAGVPIIAFSGGEPLVRKDFFEISSYASGKGMYVAIATNATLIDKETARKMKDAGIRYVQISLDGSNPETHDDFRGKEGVFERTIEGIKNCVDQNFFVNISTVATHCNYEEIPEIIDLSEKLGADWFMVYNFIPVGRGKEIKEQDLTPKEREKLLKILWRELKARKKINVLTTAPQYARIALQAEIGDRKIVPTHFYNLEFQGKLVNLAEFIGGCGAGRFYCAIRPQGNIEPCVFFHLKVGNIIDEDLEKIWENNNIFRELRNKDLLKPMCGTCEYRYNCGGCRARALSYFGDYLAPDPGCIKNESYMGLSNEMIFTNEKILSGEGYD